MAIKISGTTVIDDSRDINNVGIITVSKLLITDKVGIGTDSPDTSLTPYSTAANEGLLHFDMGSPENRRGWKFEQLNTDTSTGLKLKANVNSKPFEIHSSTDVVHFKVHTHETTGSVQIPVKVGIADSIYHLADDNTNIRFPANDTFSAETAGSERFRITSTGAICFGDTDNSDDGYGQSGQVLTSNADAPPTWQDSGGGSTDMLEVMLFT